MRLRFAPAAVDDLDSLEAYIGETSEDAARDVGDALYKCCVSLTKCPEMGPARDDLAPGLRYFPHSSRYLIFYRIQNDVLEIVRILHGSMDYAQTFE